MKYCWLTVLILLIAKTSTAQSSKDYIQPQYKIQYKDTNATLLQIVNYYDRTFYTKHIRLRRVLADSSAQYFYLYIDTASGIGFIPRAIKFKVQLLIGKTLLLQDIVLKQNKLNRIEIRSEGGFVSLPMRMNQSSNLHTIKGSIVNLYDSSAFDITLPYHKEHSSGTYYIHLKTNPVIHKKVYVKPSVAFEKTIDHDVLFQAINTRGYDDFKLFYANYPFKKFKLCKEGVLDNTSFVLWVQPMKMYKFIYRKKGRKKYKTKRFYISRSMATFVVEL